MKRRTPKKHHVMAKRRKRRKKSGKNLLGRVLLFAAKALWAVVRGLYWLVVKTCVIAFKCGRRLWGWMIRGTEQDGGVIVGGSISALVDSLRNLPRYKWNAVGWTTVALLYGYWVVFHYEGARCVIFPFRR